MGKRQGESKDVPAINLDPLLYWKIGEMKILKF